LRFLQVYKKKALTLIEVVISLAILFIIMIPISTMAIQTIKMNKQAEDKQQATVLAKQLMEKVKSLPKFIDGELTDGVILQVGSSPYKIQGEIDGFKVEGTIEPVEGYSREIVDETTKVEVDATIKTPKEDSNDDIKVDGTAKNSFIADFKEIKARDEHYYSLNLEFSGDASIMIKDKAAIEIIVDENSSSDYKISVTNNTSKTLELYCYKYKTSTSKFQIINEKGKVVYFNNLIRQDSPAVSNTLNRVYNVYIKVSKGNSFYEINSSKAMVR